MRNNLLGRLRNKYGKINYIMNVSLMGDNNAGMVKRIPT